MSPISLLSALVKTETGVLPLDQVLVAFTGPCEVMTERKSFQVTRPKDSVRELLLPQGLSPLSSVPVGPAAGTRKVTQG